MTDKYDYKVIQIGVSDTSQAPIAKDLFYKCLMCDGIIPSRPNDSIGCECCNITIDVDMHRLHIDDYQKFAIVQKIKL